MEEVYSTHGIECKIHVYGDTTRCLPVVYVHTFENQGREIWNESCKMQARQHVLVEIDGLDWDNYLAPWPTEQLFKNNPPMRGRAGEWLRLLEGEVIPAVEAQLHVTHRVIAGYSLAGLFALWSAYNTGIFAGVVACSGSFWYPDFTSYVQTHDFVTPPSCIYFSLGDKETRLKNPVLNTVEERTRWLCEHYSSMGINTVFQLTNGNHYQQPAWRTARGITWALRQL